MYRKEPIKYGKSHFRILDDYMKLRARKGLPWVFVILVVDSQGFMNEG